MTDQRRQDERLLAGLRFLADQSEPAPRKDVWEAASAEVPMSETEPNFVPSRPESRGRNAFWFGTSTLGRAGSMAAVAQQLSSFVRQGLRSESVWPADRRTMRSSRCREPRC